MSGARVRLGRRGEELAAAELARRGYEVVDRNWRCREAGEVDLVARRDGAWHFVEVRTRRGSALGTPEESITAAKRERMEAVARAYLSAHDLSEVDWRLAVAAVELDAAGRLVRFGWYASIT